MAQGMLERVVKEANTPAASPAAFNAMLAGIEKNIYGLETLVLPMLKEARNLQHRRIKLKYGPEYRPISLDALRSYRTKQGWPAIAIFSLDMPRFEISLQATAWRSRQTRKFTRPDHVKFTPDLPPALTDCFDDVIMRMQRYVQRDFGGYSLMDGPIVLAAEYRGLIPLDIKEKIVKASTIFSQIFILAEPMGWSLHMPAVLPADPLVVGWDGKELWFIAEYDTTPVEDALLTEGPANKQK
jgi:hypothetical protein